MIICSECHKVITNDEIVYQVRYGNWVEHDAQDPGEFEAKEDVAYYHEDCFPLKVD